jgi:hypothetical protein
LYGRTESLKEGEVHIFQQQVYFTIKICCNTAYTALWNTFPKKAKKKLLKTSERSGSNCIGAYKELDI